MYKSTLKPGEPALTTELIGRRIAYPFALLAKRLGMSANAVTIIAGGCWMISLPLPCVAGAAFMHGRCNLSMIIWFAAGFLWNAGYILDIADGSLARMTGTASKRGYYLDHVFHLLFKPAFLLSIGLGLALVSGDMFSKFCLLILSVLSIPANWSATQCAVEHVICETHGKHEREPELSDDDFRKLWLGTNEINDSARTKRSAPARFIKTCVREILSYYGQFTFFSATVLADILLSIFTSYYSFRVTLWSFAVLTVLLTIRLPFKVWREYKRAALAD